MYIKYLPAQHAQSMQPKDPSNRRFWIKSAYNAPQRNKAFQHLAIKSHKDKQQD